MQYAGASCKTPGVFELEGLSLFLLPRFSPQDYYSLLEIIIPKVYLSFQYNIAVDACAVWGTDIYSDDSDIVTGTLIFLKKKTSAEYKKQLYILDFMSHSTIHIVYLIHSISNEKSIQIMFHPWNHILISDRPLSMQRTINGVFRKHLYKESNLINQIHVFTI